MAANYFRPYLYGQEFRLRTDHASLLIRWPDGWSHWLSSGFS